MRATTIHNTNFVRTFRQEGYGSFTPESRLTTSEINSLSKRYRASNPADGVGSQRWFSLPSIGPPSGPPGSFVKLDAALERKLVRLSREVERRVNQAASPDAFELYSVSVASNFRTPGPHVDGVFLRGVMTVEGGDSTVVTSGRRYIFPPRGDVVMLTGKHHVDRIGRARRQLTVHDSPARTFEPHDRLTLFFDFVPRGFELGRLGKVTRFGVQRNRFPLASSEAAWKQRPRAL